MWFGTQKLLNKSKEKTVNTYLKLFDAVVRPVALYACECWGDHYSKNRNFQKIEKLHLSISKNILGVSKTTNSMKVLAELGQFPLRVSIETQMFKYFQRFPFHEDSRYVYKAFIEETKTRNIDKKGWMTYMSNILDRYGLPNLMINLLDITKGKIRKEDYCKKHKFFQKRVKDNYIQENFLSYLNKNEDTDNFFKIKQIYEKEKYLSLHNLENRKAISKLRTSSHKLGNVLAKWYKNNKNIQICKYCNSSDIEDENHFFFECKRYETIRNDTFQIIKETENINLKTREKTEKLRALFAQGSLKSLNIIGAFIKKAFEIRECNES